MARVPSKHGRDLALDFEGFLNNLQDWELSLKESKDKKLKPGPLGEQISEASSRRIGLGQNLSTRKSSSYDSMGSNAYEHPRSFDSMTYITNSLNDEESSPDAASEKELGNEYFKKKRFREAIDCYSRSIALSPTAVAYANRAMAFLKIKKFQEAEVDCTEALNFDDRYIKAYSRRATARKELGKLKESLEDSEFALKLDPQSQEIKKQHAETKSLCKKKILEKASGAQSGSLHGASVSSGSQRTNTPTTPSENVKDKQLPLRTSITVDDVKTKKVEVQKLHGGTVFGSNARAPSTNHKDLEASLQELASRAASQAMAEAAKNIAPPDSAYQFEVSWRALSGNCELQARLLKAISPNALARLFKNALSAPMLVDIFKCVASFFREDMNLAVQYLHNLTKVARFDMIVLCLSSTDRADIFKTWDEVFCSERIPTETADILAHLRPKYCTR